MKSIESIYVTTDYMPSDLMQIIHSSNPLAEEQIVFILFQILSALKYLHSANILHRDLKPSNILINEDCEVKLCDFGLARAIDESEKNNTDLTIYVTTRIYRAPELLFLIGNYTQAIDVWSVGCIFAEMLIRRPLFACPDHMKIAQKIYDLVGSIEEIKGSDFESRMSYFQSFEKKKDPNQSFDNIFGAFSDTAKDLLSKMLVLDPSKRITIDDALNHPYFEDYKEEIEELENCEKKFNCDFETSSSDSTKLKQEIVREIFSFSKNIDEVIYKATTAEYKSLKKASKVHHFISFAKK
mmetsp:Transcript_8723/g.8265  ORF Transcript_8723/g.8265 Transcript_8723/m.8265 type:complete len:297 (-) Transcript_8723:8-898(-)